jgi:hypothetical protein
MLSQIGGILCLTRGDTERRPGGLSTDRSFQARTPTVGSSGLQNAKCVPRLRQGLPQIPFKLRLFDRPRWVGRSDRDACLANRPLFCLEAAQGLLLGTSISKSLDFAFGQSLMTPLSGVSCSIRVECPGIKVGCIVRRLAAPFFGPDDCDNNSPSSNNLARWANRALHAQVSRTARILPAQRDLAYKGILDCEMQVAMGFALNRRPEPADDPYRKSPSGREFLINTRGTLPRVFVCAKRSRFASRGLGFVLGDAKGPWEVRMAVRSTLHDAPAGKWTGCPDGGVV